MKIAGKCFVDIEVEIARVPDHNPEIKLDESGVLWVKVYEGTKSFWAVAERLKTESEAKIYMVERLLSELNWAYKQVDMSKAEMKRTLIARGIISR